MKSLRLIDEAAEPMVIRPLVATEKQDIANMVRQISAFTKVGSIDKMKGQSAVEIDLPRVPVNSAICVIIGVRHPFVAEESPLLNESFTNVSICQH